MLQPTLSNDAMVSRPTECVPQVCFGSEGNTLDGLGLAFLCIIPAIGFAEEKSYLCAINEVYGRDLHDRDQARVEWRIKMSLGKMSLGPAECFEVQ